MRRRQFIAGLGAAAWPLAARAQQAAVPVIGFLSSNSGNAARPVVAAFHRGLSEQGYVDGRNVEILYRWAETRFDRLPALAADLVRRQVSVIVTAASTPAARAAKSATSTIPIVFVVGGDPVELGLVASLNRPSGNLTGTSFLTTTLVAKRLELLHEIAPAATPIGYLVNPTNPVVDAEIREANIAARTLGVDLAILNVSSPNDIEVAFAILVARRIGVLMIASDPLFLGQGDQLAKLAAHNAVPAMYNFRDFVEAGGLVSYGADFSDAWRTAGTYAGRILKGERPADLPVQQSTKVELVINLKTAKALGLTLPITLLGRADEVIE